MPDSILGTTNLLRLRLAADARSGYTFYPDDQSWELALGQNDEPAMALQTRYGGRAGLVRLVPMIHVQNRSVYEKQAFASPVQITNLAPDALQVEVEVISGLNLRMLFWTMTSRALGGRFTITNNGTQVVSLRAELFAQAMREQQSIAMSLLTVATPDKGTAIALSLGEIGNLHPVLLMDRAQETNTAKLSAPLEISGGQSINVRFVLASMTTIDKSVDSAYNLLREDWSPRLKEMTKRRDLLPSIDTADDQLDAAILISQQVALQSMIGATNSLPHPSPVFVRVPAFGFSPHGDGSDHPRGWEGQTALDTYHLISALITLDPALAKGIVKNYLATQHPDGWIDAAPGAAGQRDGHLLTPLLAQMALLIYRHTEDQKFVGEVLPGLFRFYSRWFAADMDGDGDGFPEWQIAQEYHPTPDVRQIEAPDLASYLLNEGDALATLAEIAGRKKDWSKVEKLHSRLAKSLQKSWNAEQGRFFYRDRDTDKQVLGEQVFRGKGDQQLPISVKLSTPNRLLIRIKGGDYRPKNLKATIKGIDQRGKSASEVIENVAFSWHRLGGSTTTRTLWQQVDSLVVEGLSRVYDIEVDTVDLTRHDASLLLPYTTAAINEAQVEGIFDDLQQHYTDKFGIRTLTDDSDVGQRVILPWVAMIGLMLLRRGEDHASVELFERLAAAQVTSLIQQGRFFQWYHAENGTGIGLPDHATGIIPLYWLMHLIGVLVRDEKTVEILGELAFKRKIQLVQYGVKISRSNRKTSIKFPSGHTLDLAPDAPPAGDR